METSLVALTPADMAPAQQQMVAWCQEKCKALGKDLRDQRENLRLAKLHKWRSSGWSNQISKTKARMVYYAKIAAACKAGYLLVPNFEVELFAVRVDREAPDNAVRDGSWPLTLRHQAAPGLPPGGHYVGATPVIEDISDEEVGPDGKKRQVPQFYASGYGPVDFPVCLVKPMVLEATQRAMALRLFDRLGVATGRKQDPVVLGQIVAPKTGYSSRHVSFFIAWWLDWRML